MNRAFHRCWVVPFACVALVAPFARAQTSDTLSLRVGGVFPRLAAQTISGRAIDVPEAHATVPVVVILSFSRQAGKAAQRWDELLAPQRSRGEIDVIVVAEIQSVPRLIRGTVAYTIRRGVPQELRDHMVLLDRDEETWKRRLAVTSTDEAYAVLVDASGRVAWMSEGRSPDASVGQLGDAIRLLKPTPSARPPNHS